jgi:hypothetical protein
VFFSPDPPPRRSTRPRRPPDRYNPSKPAHEKRSKPSKIKLTFIDKKKRKKVVLKPSPSPPPSASTSSSFDLADFFDLAAQPDIPDLAPAEHAPSPDLWDVEPHSSPDLWDPEPHSSPDLWDPEPHSSPDLWDPEPPPPDDDDDDDDGDTPSETSDSEIIYEPIFHLFPQITAENVDEFILAHNDATNNTRITHIPTLTHIEIRTQVEGMAPLLLITRTQTSDGFLQMAPPTFTSIIAFYITNRFDAFAADWLPFTRTNISVSFMDDNGLERSFSTPPLPTDLITDAPDAFNRFLILNNFLTGWRDMMRDQMLDNQAGASGDFFIFDDALDMLDFTTTTVVIAPAAGCSQNRDKRTTALIKQGKAVAIDTEDNDCIQRAIRYVTGRDTTLTDYEEIAQELRINIHVYKYELPRRRKLVLDYVYGDQRGMLVHLLEDKKHVDVLVFNRKILLATDDCYFCVICSKWSTKYHSERHKRCPFCKLTYVDELKHRLSCKKMQGTIMPLPKAQKLMDLTKIIHFCDFETFMYRGRHVPYFAALKTINDPDTKTFHGRDCAEKLIDHIMRLTGIVYFYNGSAFDIF